MGRSRITIVGAGNVGATAAHLAAQKQLGDIVLIDIVEGLAEGKALDLSEAAPVELYDARVTGGVDWSAAAGSEVVIVTSGLPRRPGMSRDDLLVKNVKIVRGVTQQIVKYAPESVIIVVCNPLDAMVYTAAKVSGFAKSRVIGMAGALDTARLCSFIAAELNVSVEDVQGVVLGGHGDDMVPLVRYTAVRGIPVSELVSPERMKAIIDRTRNGGIEVVNLLGVSAYYAPAAGAVRMAEAVMRDKKAVFSCCAYCDRQYGAAGYFVGVPVVMGAGGVQRIIELELNEAERKAFARSLDHVKELVGKVDEALS